MDDKFEGEAIADLTTLVISFSIFLPSSPRGPEVRREEAEADHHGARAHEVHRIQPFVSPLSSFAVEWGASPLKTYHIMKIMRGVVHHARARI